MIQRFQIGSCAVLVAIALSDGVAAALELF